MGKWWNSEKKGQPVAVATPVLPNQQLQYIAPSAPYQEMPAYNPNPKMVMMAGPSHQTGDAGLYRTAPQELYHSMGGRTQLHKTLILISMVAGLTGINNAIAQALGLTYPGSNIHFEIVLRFYLIGFCVLVALNESERIPIIRNSALLYNFIGRGIFYCFLGVLGQNLYDVGFDNRYRGNGYYGSSSSSYRSGDYYGYYGPRMPTSEDFCEWYIWLTSICMFMVGIVYLLLGATCMQSRLETMRQQYQQQQLPPKDGILIAESHWRV
jgi:COPI associated protein